MRLRLVGALALAAALLVPAAAGAQPRNGAAPKPAVKPPAPGAPAKARTGAARPREDRGEPVTVEADHMDHLGKESIVIFTGNVVARQNGSVQYADRMEVYQDEKGKRILRTVSTGNVRIVTRDCKVGTARRAEYFDLDQRIVLIGNARVWQDDDVVTGETITIYLSQDRNVVQGGKQERVKAVFYPRDDAPPEPAAAAAPAPPTAGCE